MKLTGKQIAVLGAGESGFAAARLAQAEGASVCVYDSGNPDKLTDAAVRMKEAGIRCVLGDDALNAPSGGLDMTVLSPGIDQITPLAQAFIATGAELVSEIEFAFRLCGAGTPIVAVTGTNGKTTTTEMVAVLLNHGGQRTIPSGNYGRPFSDIVRAGDTGDVIALEVSSFQLEAIRDFRPDVSVWLNFAPDHMDRYRTVDEYFQAKYRIFENQTSDDTAVVNAAEIPDGIRARQLSFSAFEDGGDFSYGGGRIAFHGRDVLDFSRTKLSGRHNVENLMAAMGVAYSCGIPLETVAEAIRDYTPPRHRCEVVGEFGGKVFVNDSKATNLHALRSSLRGQEAPVVLIAGGKNKGLDYAEIRDVVAQKVTRAITIGEMSGAVCRAWDGAVPCEEAVSLQEAVEIAARHASPGQTVLFSPGTSSFDMFSSYAERGDAFATAVNQLKKQDEQ